MALDINFPAVVAATIIQMVLGMVWYGPIFGKQWMALTGMTEEKGKAGMKRAMTIGVSASFITAFIMAGMLAATGVDSAKHAVKMAIVLWLGFNLTVEMHGIAWEQRPVKLMWINVGYSLVNFVLVAVVLYYASTGF